MAAVTTLPQSHTSDVPVSVLIYMTGSLGDTLTTVPALWAIRSQWPSARVTVLSDAQQGQQRIVPEQVLGGSGMVDEFLSYPAGAGPPALVRKARSSWHLWRILRRERPDVVVYLVRAFHGDTRVRRDVWFLRLSGVRHLVGATALEPRPLLGAGGALGELPRLADIYLRRLSVDGLVVPAAGMGRADLAVGPDDHEAVRRWRAILPDDGGRAWLAVGLGSNMPAKMWPVDRYLELVGQLIADFDVWPVVFGGGEDRAVAERLISTWGRGYVAAGHLGVRAAAAALSRVRCYVGNDTGTMHLAASAGVPCVTLFAARDFPGLWEPYGGGHETLRLDVPCQGCGLDVCSVLGHPCMQGISVQRVREACEKILTRAGMAKPPKESEGR